MSEPNLDQYRKQIAEIDDEIIELLVKRFELTDSIGVFKKKRKMDIENKEVENKLLSRLIVASNGKLDPDLVLNIYSEILKESKKRQKEI